MLSDEWLSRYELLENLNIKLCRSVTGTRTRDGPYRRAKNGIKMINFCPWKVQTADTVHRIPGFCPWKVWTLSRDSMESLDIVHGHPVHSTDGQLQLRVLCNSQAN